MKQQIWFYHKGYYKAYVNDSKIKNKLKQWKDCHLADVYSHANGENGWGFVFPSSLYNNVAELLGLPQREKNKNRVLAGKNSKVGTGEERYDLTKVNSQNPALVTSNSNG